MTNQNYKPKLLIMVGISGSGKSTIAKQIAEKLNYNIVSSDAIRGEICNGNISDQSKNDEVFKIFHKRIKEYLLAGKNVIADATNITIKSRKAILDLTKDIDCEKYAYITPKRYEDCINDNKNSDRVPVPDEVIKRQMSRFQIPYFEEGFDRIVVHDFNYPNDAGFIYDLSEKMDSFEQKNPFHSMTLGEHCYYTSDKFVMTCSNMSLLLGSLFHDVGKMFTQTFDESGVAHYYGHENVGTYYLLSNINNLQYCFKIFIYDILELLFLVNYHMMPMNWKHEKTKNKYKKMFGENKFNMLIKFHECDKARPVESINNEKPKSLVKEYQKWWRINNDIFDPRLSFNKVTKAVLTTSELIGNN